MAAECWGCDAGMSRVGSSSASRGDPLGTCWECHAFSCSMHARRDPGAGKWLCYACVAMALGVSGGIEDERLTRVRFDSSDEFQSRFAELAEATSEHRSYWRQGAGEGRLGNFLDRKGIRETTEWSLAADALGVAVFLVTPEPDQLGVDVFAEPSATRILSARLAEALAEIGHGN